MYRFAHLSTGVPLVQAIDGEVRGDRFYFPNPFGTEINVLVSALHETPEAVVAAEKSNICANIERHRAVHAKNIRVLNRQLRDLDENPPFVGTFEDLNKRPGR